MAAILCQQDLNFEGVAYTAFQNAGAEREALFRFFNTATGTHFFTTNVTERDTVISTMPQFRYEGIAFYVGGNNAAQQLDLTTTQGGTRIIDLAAISATSIKLGGGNGAPSAPTAPGGTANDSSNYTIVNNVAANDIFELISTKGGNGGPGTPGGNGGSAYVFTPASNTASDLLSLSLAGGATIAGGDSGGNPGLGGAGLLALQMDQLTISSTGAAANSIIGGANADGSLAASIVLAVGATITVTGTQNLNLGTLGGAGTTVNAAAFSGSLTVVGDSGSNRLIGGVGNDLIDGAAGADILTGGSGVDTFQIFLGDTPLAAFDTITDFNSGGQGDQIRSAAIDNVAAASATAPTAGVSVGVTNGGKVVFAAADDTLAERLAVLNADDTRVGSQTVVFFEFGADTYVYFENSIGSGDEQLIMLSGLTGLTTLTEIGSNGDFILA